MRIVQTFADAIGTNLGGSEALGPSAKCYNVWTARWRRKHYTSQDGPFASLRLAGLGQTGVLLVDQGCDVVRRQHRFYAPIANATLARSGHV